MTTKTIAIVLSSHEQLGDTGKSTGYYVSEAAHPWQVFRDAGYTVDLISIAGGEPPRDGEDISDPIQERFLTDPGVADQLARTTPIADADPAAYDAVLLAGGHGTMWDFRGPAGPASLVTAVWERGGVVGAVCHGPAGLLDATLSDGTPLLSGRKVAGFTNSEEDAVGLSDVVPFALETELRARGADHRTAPLWEPHTIRDGRLVTGQNPASATGVAEEMLTALQS